MSTSDLEEDAFANIVHKHLVHNCENHFDEDSVSLNNISDIVIPYHLPGAAITHDIYSHANSIAQKHQIKQRAKSSQALPTLSQNLDEEESMFEHLDKPGGFRRFHVNQQQNFAIQNVNSSASENPAFQELFRPDSICSNSSRQEYTVGLFKSSRDYPPRTRHFLEHLVITSAISQFAGENLSDSENEETDISESTRLLSQDNRIKVKREDKADIQKTVFLLFKAFIGSGILFLPKAFSNGGLVFSIITMWSMGAISLYCFLLLLDCKKQYSGSYGDIGGQLYGPWMRNTVLFSISISQLGFMCGGTIFIVQNVIEAIQVISHGRVILDPRGVFVILIILITPLVLIRNIAKLSPAALLSDVLIVFGLLVLLVYDCIKIFTPLSNIPHNGPNIQWLFNPVDYTVFIGTAVYSYEGIGLVIPIRDAMEKPDKFPVVLTFVMFLVACTLCTVGTLGYFAFGQQVETIALLNLPPGIIPNSIQISYSVAVLLSNSLTLFPTIRIIEQAFFGNLTGKYNSVIKWQKNTLRITVVIFGTLVAWLGADDLDKFISLIGSICCCPLSLIFPPLFHLRVSNVRSYIRYIDFILVTFGIFVMIFTFYNTAKQWAYHD